MRLLHPWDFLGKSAGVGCHCLLCRWNSKNCLLKEVKNLPNFLIIPMHPCVLSRFSRVRLFVTPCTVAHQAPLSMGFSRQEYWSGLHALLQGIFPAQGSNPSLMSLAWQAGSLPWVPLGKPIILITGHRYNLDTFYHHCHHPWQDVESKGHSLNTI